MPEKRVFQNPLSPSFAIERLSLASCVIIRVYVCIPGAKTFQTKSANTQCHCARIVKACNHGIQFVWQESIELVHFVYLAVLERSEILRPLCLRVVFDDVHFLSF